jgi:hypothetical protein
MPVTLRRPTPLFARIETAGGRAVATQADIADAQAVQRMFELAETASAASKLRDRRSAATGDGVTASFGIDDGIGTATPQQIAASLFSSNTIGTLTTAGDRFAYNQATGDLYYDAQIQQGRLDGATGCPPHQ